MEVVGYIIGILIFIVGLVIRLVRGIDKSLLETIRAIQDEFGLAYRELFSSPYEEPKLEICVRRLKGLHFHSQKDLLNLRIFDWFFGKIPLLIWLTVIITVVSVAVGQIIIEEEKFILKTIFLIIVPFVLLLIEFILLGLILKVEKYLNRKFEFYRRTQYLL